MWATHTALWARSSSTTLIECSVGFFHRLFDSCGRACSFILFLAGPCVDFIIQRSDTLYVCVVKYKGVCVCVLLISFKSLNSLSYAHIISSNVQMRMNKMKRHSTTPTTTMRPSTKDRTRSHTHTNVPNLKSSRSRNFSAENPSVNEILVAAATVTMEEWRKKTSSERKEGGDKRKTMECSSYKRALSRSLILLF